MNFYNSETNQHETEFYFRMVIVFSRLTAPPLKLKIEIWYIFIFHKRVNHYDAIGQHQDFQTLKKLFRENLVWVFYQFWKVQIKSFIILAVLRRSDVTSCQAHRRVIASGQHSFFRRNVVAAASR